MKIYKYTSITCLLFIALTAQSQALRITGYQGTVGLSNGYTFPVSGPSRVACDDEFDRVATIQSIAAGAEVSERYSQKCAPSFVYRSPTAPATSVSPAATLIPQMTNPPLCFSCLVFEYPGLIKDLYPDHNQQVQGYVQQFKIDAYNHELMALQSRYKSHLEQFEKKIFALEENLSSQAK